MNAQHCGVSLSECTCTAWEQLHVHDYHQNATEHNTTSGSKTLHTKYTCMHNAGTVSQDS